MTYLCAHCRIRAVSKKRFHAGHPYCMTCGDKLAHREIEQKKRSVAPAFNKGGLQYQGSTPQRQKQLAQDIVAGMPPEHVNVSTLVSSITPSETKSPNSLRTIIGKRKRIGIAWVWKKDGSGKTEAVSIYDTSDPRWKNAVRRVAI